MELARETVVTEKSAVQKHTLASLARMDSSALERLYRGGRVPESLSALNGHPRGRMLAVRGADRGRVADALRRFAGARGFPWGGKSFSATAPREGTGINRVHLFGRHQLFPFKTHVGSSRIDAEPTVVLDYDLRDNPGVIRKIHDEIREVSPGVYLGPAMWKTEEGATLVLWFALDTNESATPIGEG